MQARGTGRAAGVGHSGRGRRLSRSGMTFLEVVFGAALVVMISASSVGLFTYLSATQHREQRLLACAEVANRLMLNYLDNPAAMPDPNKVVEYGPEEQMAKYRWEIDEQRVEMVEALPEGRDKTREGPLKRDRMKQVTIRAWLSELSGGSRAGDGSTPQVTLTRMVDPLAMRNPDSTENMLKDPAAYQKWFEAMMGFTQGQTVAPAGSSTAGGAPRTEARATGLGKRKFGGKASPRESFQRGRTTRESGSWAYEQWGGPGGGRR